MEATIDKLLDAHTRGESYMPAQVDFSNFISYITCPRSWLLKNIIGLHKKHQLPSVDLVVGSGVHSGLEAGFRALQDDPELINSPLVLGDIAVEAFYETWEAKDGDEIDLREVEPKTPHRAVQNLRNYWTHYELDIREQTVRSVEMPFSIPIASGGYPLLYGTVDLVTSNPNELIVSEHKTCSTFALSWQTRWDNSFQLEAYTLAAWLYFGQIPAVCVDGLLFQKTQPFGFKRLWFKKSVEQIHRFYGEVKTRMEQLCRDTDTWLREIKAGKSWESAFPRNPNACHVFRTCQFYDICPTLCKASSLAHRAPVGWEHVYTGVYTETK